MRLTEAIQQKSSEFSEICKSHKVSILYAFGSSITDRFNEEKSDIDFLVEVGVDDPIERGEKLMSLWDKFEGFFNRKVDLLTETSIKNPILRKNIDKTKILIYEGRGQKILV